MSTFVPTSVAVATVTITSPSPPPSSLPSLPSSTSTDVKAPTTVTNASDASDASMAAESSLQWGATPELTGSCWCKKVQFEARGKEIWCAYCHCTICQRLLGGVAALFAGYQPSDFRITRGADQLEPLQSSEMVKRFRCRGCGTQVYGECVDPEMKFCDFPITLLTRCPKGYILAAPGPLAGVDKAKTPSLLVPSCHINYNMRIQSIKDGLPKWEGMPGASPLIDE